MKTGINPRVLERIKNIIIWAGVLLGTSFGASLIMLQSERAAGNTHFDTVPEVYWWWLSTVGGLGAPYEPITESSRIIAAFVIFSGFILLGLFISEFTTILKMIYARKSEGNIKINYKDHIIIFGYASLTAGVIKLIKRHFGQKTKIVLISNDIHSNPFPGEVDFIHDNPISNSTFIDANISEATAAIILANDRFRDPDTYSLVIASGVEKYNNKVVTISEITDQENSDLFKKVKIDAFINRKEMIRDLLDHNPDPKIIRVISKGTPLYSNIDEEVSTELV